MKILTGIVLLSLLLIGCAESSAKSPTDFNSPSIYQWKPVTVPSLEPYEQPGPSRLIATPSPSPVATTVLTTPKPTTKPSNNKWNYDRNVSWYGPGFYCESKTLKGCLKTGREWHNGTACGNLYTTTILGVAHRTLPCGTKVSFMWKGKSITVKVIDRGPYVAGRQWDLSGGLCKYLNHCFTGPIYYRVGGLP